MSPAPELPCRVLLLSDAEAASPAALCTAMARSSCRSLVQDALEQRAEAVLIWLPQDPAQLTDCLDAIAGLPEPLPVLACVPGASLGQQRSGFERGVQVWLENAEGINAALHWARWQFERQQALQSRLDERRWAEQAKGVLMQACAIDEDAAHRLLREAAMQARLRMAELSRSVVQAAQLAEGVNLAGQQRMLSQRIVKLIAQRAAAIEPRRAKQLQDESAARIEANLARLHERLPAFDLHAVNSAWGALKPLLTGKPTAEVLMQADAAAQDLLERSEQLTHTIEAAGAGRPLHLVNVCGRQRMLSQRLAKQALLADLLPGSVGANMGESLDAFASGLAELEAAPLSSPAIRELQAEAREEWLHLLRALRGSHGREAASGLARSSEVLLGQLDRLTANYQQSLQVLLA